MKHRPYHRPITLSSSLTTKQYPYDRSIEQCRGTESSATPVVSSVCIVWIASRCNSHLLSDYPVSALFHCGYLSQRQHFGSDATPLTELSFIHPVSPEANPLRHITTGQRNLLMANSPAIKPFEHYNTPIAKCLRTTLRRHQRAEPL